MLHRPRRPPARPPPRPTPAGRRAAVRPARRAPGRADRVAARCSPATGCPPSSSSPPRTACRARSCARRCTSSSRAALLRVAPGLGRVRGAAAAATSRWPSTRAVLDSVQAVVQVVEVRRVLEGEIAALAAERATRAQIAALRRALQGHRPPRSPTAATASPKTWPSTARIGESTGNPQFRLLLGFLEQYLREGMRITRGNEARRARLHGGGAARAPRHRRGHRRARPRGGAPPRHRDHILRGEQRLVDGGAALPGAGAPKRTSKETDHETADHRRRRLRRRAPRAHPARARHARRASASSAWCSPTWRRRRADLAGRPARRGAHRPAARADRGACATEAFDGVFHLASAVSGECEADFDLGLRSNLDSTRALLDALRADVARGGKADAPRLLQLGRGVRPRPGRAAARRWSPTTRCPRRRPRTARRS